MPAALLILNLIDDLAGSHGRANHSVQQFTERNVIKRVNTATAYARVRKIPVIWSRVGFSEDYQDMAAHSPLFAQIKLIGALRLNSPGCAWLDSLEIDAGDWQFTHTGLSAFTGNNLLTWLQQHQRRRLLIGGISTSLAVESTVREAHDRGIQAMVMEDLCADNSLLSHQQSIDNLQRIAEIITTSHWMQP